MEEDIENYSPTVMFRGTPSIFHGLRTHLVFFRKPEEKFKGVKNNIG